MSRGNLKKLKSSEAFGSVVGLNSEPSTISKPRADTLLRSDVTWLRVSPQEIAMMLAASVLVLLPSYFAWWPIGVAEGWGFVTGGICVWLVVREHIWNWPIGLLNNVFFFFLFLQARLFADMGLQVVYFGLGLYGWLNWLYGGENRSILKVNRTTRAEWLMLATAIPFCTWGLSEILFAVNGTAPFWDSLTTVLSLTAQYLLCRKRFENWFFWIAADVIYIPLYVSRHLPLTAALYSVFLVMCLFGVREWNRSLRKGTYVQ